MKKVSLILLVLVAVVICAQGVSFAQTADQVKKDVAAAKDAVAPKDEVTVVEETAQLVDDKGDAIEETDWEALWGDEPAEEAAPADAKAAPAAPAPAK